MTLGRMESRRPGVRCASDRGRGRRTPNCLYSWILRENIHESQEIGAEFRRNRRKPPRLTFSGVEGSMSSSSNVPDKEGALLRIRHFMSALTIVVFPPVLVLGADSPAVAVLKEKGLTRSGRLFVIEAEKPVLEKWKEARSVLADYLATAERKNESDLAARESEELQAHCAELQEKLTELNQQINEQGFQQVNGRAGGFGQGAYLSQLIAQRNLIRMNLAEITPPQKSIGADAAPDRKTLEVESKRKMEAARAVLAEIRGSVDAVTKRYDELNSDASVRSGLQSLEKEKLGTFKLGPSTSFKAAVKALDNAEKMILAKKTSAVSRRKAKLKK